MVEDANGYPCSDPKRGVRWCVNGAVAYEWPEIFEPWAGFVRERADANPRWRDQLHILNDIAHATKHPGVLRPPALRGRQGATIFVNNFLGHKVICGVLRKAITKYEQGEAAMPEQRRAPERTAPAPVATTDGQDG